MATYIALVNYTDQGVKNVKDSPKRLDAAKKLIKDLGGELKAFYLTMGAHDIVTVAEAPHDEAIARRYGFRGGLVPGVTVYAYMTHPLAEAFGTGWLERGTASVRFVKPVLD